MWLFELELFLFVNWYPSEHVVSAPSIFSSKKYFSIITFKRVWGQKNDKFWMNNRSHQVTWAKLLKNLWIFQYLFMQWVLSVYKKYFDLNFHSLFIYDLDFFIHVVFIFFFLWLACETSLLIFSSYSLKAFDINLLSIVVDFLLKIF